jgi:hypothetical protein
MAAVFLDYRGLRNDSAQGFFPMFAGDDAGGL